MILSLNWLREFVPFGGSIEDLAHRLTMLGLEVEEISEPFGGLDKVVVGHVVECGRHPEADKLSVCTVDVGAEATLNIVCGAPNVAKGQKVAVATIGAVLPGDFKIKKSKLRGVPSEGMICAEDEMGLGEDHDGILVLDESLAVGTPIVEALGLNDTVFDIGVTPNRADCNSVLGLAREVALAYGLPLTMPSFSLTESGEDAGGLMRIDIPEAEYCPAYRGRIIQGVTTRKSPAWMRYRLLAVGQRPISNLVDITNYVMFELGQPLHAFDLDLLRGGVIKVARSGEAREFTTLDSQKRKLLADDLLIWDGEGPVALAGVMGGLDSEIHDDSANVFLEAAVFRPASIRKTARRLALPSEASYRFERGVDQPGSLFAMNRAAQLMAELGEGQLLPGVVQAEPTPWKPLSIPFRTARACSLLGIDVDDDFCVKTIKGMGCGMEKNADGDFTVSTPAHRPDLEREVDMIEEVARVYGMDRIPTVLPKVGKPLEAIGGVESEFDFWFRIKHWARGAGLNEAINYSFVGQKDLDFLGLPEDGRIAVKNPLSEDQGVLRTALAPGMLQNVRHNLAQGNTRVRLFEMAHLFEADAESDTTAREPGRLGILIHGERFGEAWPWCVESPGDADYLDLKGLVEHLLSTLRLPAPACAMAGDHPWLSPCVSVTVDGTDIGVMGRVKPELADAFHARKEIWTAELDTNALAALVQRLSPCFQPLPTFPPVRRDITVMAPKGLSVAAILDHVSGMKMPLLEDFALIDVFTPEGGDGERNLTFRLTFRSPTKTLQDKQVDKEREKVAKSLIKTLAVRI